MLSINNSPYLRVLNRVYADKAIDKSPSEIYRNWMKMKRKHSIEVAKAGIRIIRSENVLNSLDEDTKEKLLGALLLHDIARIRNKDFATGKTIKTNHGIEGARDMTELGITSPLIIIPIMIHNQMNEKFIDLKGNNLLDYKDFQNLNDEDQTFVWEQNQKFHMMPKQDQKLVRLSINLTKDADKLANLLTAKEHFSHTPKPLIPEANEKVFKRLMAGKLVKNKDRKTLADYALSWMAFTNDFRFQSTFDIMNEDKSLEVTKQTVLKRYASSGAKPKDLKNLKAMYDKVITFLKSKSGNSTVSSHSLALRKLHFER